MADSEIGKVGVIAQVATAAAAVAYPIVRAINRQIERRRAQDAERLAAAVALSEARIIDRCHRLEYRVAQLEHQLELDAAA